MSQYKQLEETLDLPELVPDASSELLENAKKFAKDFDDIEDPFELHDHEMDEIGDLALQYGKDLQDLGMGVDAKLSAEIFNAAANMLKIAVETRNSKLEKKLKLMKMDFDRMKLDRTNPDIKEIVESTSSVKVLDRNELLEQIKQIRNDSASSQ